MNEQVLKDFIEEECSDDDIDRIKSAMEECLSNRNGGEKEIFFNRFNVYLDANRKIIRIEDDLNSYEDSEFEMSFDNFLTIIDK